MTGDPPDLPGVRHEFVNAGGLRMHVALAGPEDGPPVLLVHGWPQNWWAWRRVIPALAERFRVIAVDLRGHGWTEAPARGYEKEQLASDLLALLDVLKIERATYIGHDWGGWAGFLAVLRAPDRFERMLAVCIPHPWVPPSAKRTAVMLSYQGPISLPLIGAPIASVMVSRLLQTGRFGEPLTAADLAVFTEHMSSRVTVAMYRTFLTRELPAIIRGRYANATVAVPTTVMLGARDAVTAGTPAGSVAQQPNMQIEILPDIAHWVPEQRPQDIIDWALRG